MKTIYKLITCMLILGLSIMKVSTVNAQCTFPGVFFGSATINTSGALVTISTCSFAGESSTISGAVSGQTLQFTFSGGGFITIHSGSEVGPVIAMGASPLTFVNTFTGTIFATWALNAGCATDFSCHTTTVQCMSCASSIPNDACAGAIPIACGGTVTGTTVGATPDANPCGGATSPGLWYSITSTVTGTITASLCGSGYDTRISAYSGTCAALTMLACNDDFCGLQSQISFPAVLGTTYRILVNGFVSNSGPFTLTTTCVPAGIPNDACAGAIAIACGGTVTGNTTGATPDANPCGGATSPGLWYTVTPATAANITASLCGSGYDTRISVYSGTCAALTMIACNDDFCGLQSQVTFPAVGGTTYRILVNGFVSNAGPFTLTVTCAAACPPPVNDQCTSIPLTPITVGVPTTFTGNTVCVTNTNDGAFAGYPTVWHRISLPSCATIELNYCSTSPAFGNVWLNLGTGATCPVNTFTPAGTFAPCGNGNFIVTFANMAAGDYWIPIIGQGSDPGFIVTPGPYTLVVNTIACPAPSPNQTCATAVTINCNDQLTGNTIGVTPSVLPSGTNCGSTTNNTGLWYRFNTSNPGGGIITARTCNSVTNYDTYIDVYTGTCGALTCVGFNDDDGTCTTGPGVPGFKSIFTWTANQGQDYWIFVTGFANQTGTFRLDLTCVLCPGIAGGTASGPATAPCSNSNANFTLAGSTGSIQWQMSSVAPAGPYTDVSGATSNNVNFAFPATGTWYVRARVSAAGCGDAFSNVLTYNVTLAGSAIGIAATPNPICRHATLTLSSPSCVVPGNSYSVSHPPFGTVSPVSPVAVSLGDDQVSAALPIGFSFGFFGTAYTQFYISSNGFIGFTAGMPNGCCSGGLIPSAATPNNIIAAAWDDLYPPGGGSINYFTTGVAPNRKLVVNWNAVPHFVTGPPVTMQIVLNECSGIIDINTTTMTTDGSNHTQGIENSTGTIAFFEPGRVQNPSWSLSNETTRFSPSGGGGSFASYAWSGPGSYTASGANQTITDIQDAQIGTYTITGTLANGCQSSNTVTVAQLPSPVPTASNSSPVCDGLSMQLFGDNSASGQAPNTFSWTGPGYGPVAGQNPVVSTIPLSGGGYYTVTVTNANGCTETASTLVTVNPNPVLSITSVLNEVCVGAMDGCIDVDASNGSPTYVYDLGGNSTLDGVYCGLGAGTYNVTVSDDNSCEGSINVTVIQEDNVNPTITCPPTVTVNTDAGVCYATGVNLGNPVYADNCGGLLGIANNAPVQFPQGGVIVQWEVTDLEGNKASCNQTVAVMDIEPPVALCKNICIYLNSAGAATITGADIDNGSNDNCGIQSLTASKTSFSYADAGANTVTLTVLDINGNSSTCTAIVTLGEYYSIFGTDANCSTSPSGGAGCLVNLSSGSTVNGNVGSYRLIQTGNGVTINGKVVSGGKVSYGNTTTSGSVSAANLLGVPGTIFSAGSGAQILGDIDVVGNINITASGSAVTGTVRHPVGTTYTGPVPGGGVLIAAPILPPLPGMPVTHTYTCGGANINGTATINPGSYGNLSPGGGSIITFHGPGNYYFSDINLAQGGGSRTFKYDFMNLPGNINIYVCSNIHLGGSFATQWANPNTPDGCRVYFEVQGNGVTNIGSGSNFQGRMWAPYSGINVGSGSGTCTITGSLWSAKKIDFSGTVIVNRCASPCPPGPRFGDEISTTDAMSEMLQVYPNPTTGKTTVKFFADAPYGYTLKVIDYLGRIVLSNDSKAVAGDNTQEIDLSSFAKGLYMIEVANADHSQKVKVVLQ